jgi:ribulose-phosphate 3-epimerase
MRAVGLVVLAITCFSHAHMLQNENPETLRSLSALLLHLQPTSALSNHIPTMRHHGTVPVARTSKASHSNPCRCAIPVRTSQLAMAMDNPRPVQIIPSVLPADWANMGQCVKDLEEAGVDRIQFDVMDGNFVPNLTFGPEMIAACRKYCNVPFETQLMVTNYNSDTMLEEYVEATKGPNGEPGVVIVHVEACTHLHRTLAKIRELGGSPSVALNPHTPMEMVKNVLDMVDHVLVMTVNPGFGGQAYIPTMLDKIRDLRAAIVAGGFDVDIEVDGGIKADWTLSECAAAGANCFIAGSGMFAYPTLKEGCDALRKVAQDAQSGKMMDRP